MSHVTKTSLDDCEKALNSLLNRAATPSEEKANVSFYIISAVQRVSRAFDYIFSVNTISATVGSDGIVDLSDLSLGPLPAIQSVSDGTSLGDFTFVPQSDFEQRDKGDRVYTISLNEDGDYNIVTTESSSTIQIRYLDAVDISQNEGTVFTPMVIAKGALIYYYQASDREGDTSVEEDQFKQEVSEIIEAQNRRAPQRFARTMRDVMGHHIGRS